MKTKTTLLITLYFISLFSCYRSNAQVNSTPPQFTQEKILLSNIGQPWGMTFINKDTLLYTERSGKLFRYIISSNTRTEITGTPTVIVHGQGGMLDVEIHPDFAQNNFVYLTYSVAVNGGQTTAIGRGKLSGTQLADFDELFRALPYVNNTNHFGSRIAFDNDNNVYFSMGDRGTSANAQNLGNHAGKVMRLKDDGSIPEDNPFVGNANARPEIFTYGNRNVQGLALNPANGKIYAQEHGPKGGDELNVLKPGANYGWPSITFGKDYDDSVISEDTAREGMEQPLTYWVPSIAPAGLLFLNNNQAEDEADILLGALAGTHVHYLKLKNDKVIQSSKSLQGAARFRDVAQSPDGSIYALTEQPNQLIKLRSSIVTSTEEIADNLFKAFVFPNPGNEESMLTFTLPVTQKVQIRILSMDGALLHILTDQNLPAGQQNISMAGIPLSKGAYQIEILREKEKSVVKWIKI